ncbi:hypothetical protein GCM10023149_22850 [Mucilaginibacter gynuensis]|uniref:Uncharacterized protein n=1 Tax=Mucilaginibacter gynuensis TaxID=1302236 RepID=A0ABP8GE86_9SPHI
MSKHHLTVQTRLLYIGRGFEGFREDEPHMTFLGYDGCGWSSIWVDYLGIARFITLDDVEIAE